MDITVQVISVPLGNIIRTQVFDVGSDQRQSLRSFFAAEHVLRLEVDSDIIKKLVDV